ncbi:MAG: hypothetical protein LDLANPLL_01936 [Turneriella sp.]|nr:hypothetical protein [Turneriella sp.]
MIKGALYLLFFISLLFANLCFLFSDNTNKIVIFYNPQINIHTIIKDGILSRLPNAQPVDSREINNTLSDCDSQKLRAIITVGKSSTDTAISFCKKTPIIFTLVSAPKFLGYQNYTNVTGVSQDIPMDTYLENLQSLLAKGTKIGFAYQSDESNYLTSEIEFIESKYGITSIRRKVSSLKELGPVLENMVLERKIRAFWMVPDALFNMAAFQKLAKLCYKHKILLITSFRPLVRDDGAAFAIAPSYFSLGVQTAALVRNVMHSKQPSDFAIELPEKTGIYVSEKIIHDFNLRLPDRLKFRQRISVLIEEGQNAYKEQKYATARALFLKALQLDRTNTEAQHYSRMVGAQVAYQQARQMLASGNKANAVLLLMSAASFVPEARDELVRTRNSLRHNLPSLVQAGENAYNNKKYKECIQQMTIVLAVDPEHRVAQAYIQKSKSRMKAIKAIR